MSNGPHAEFVSVPANLCAKIPDKVSDEEAAFTVVGAIGLQGIRLDLLRFLAGTKMAGSEIIRMKANTDDTVTIQLAFADGSIGTIHYFANGSKAFPKERLEVFCGQKILQMYNFKSMAGYGWRGFHKMNLWSQDKGHGAEVKAFVDAVEKGGPGPISFDEIVEVFENTIKLG